MPHTDRRKEVGKALIDIGKYSFTAGIVGSAITDRWTLQVVVICAIISLLAFIIGFYTIPESELLLPYGRSLPGRGDKKE